MDDSNEAHHYQHLASTRKKSKNNQFGNGSDFKDIWKEFLLIFLDPTLAATEALKALKEVPSSVSALKEWRQKCENYQHQLIEPILSQQRDINYKQIENATDFFQDLYCLTKTFQRHDNSDVVDVRKVDAFFDNLCRFLDTLDQPKSEEIAEKIATAIQKLGDHLETTAEKNPNSFAHSVQVQCILILAGAQIFDTFPMTSLSALSELHRLVTKLPEHLREVLCLWYSEISLSVLRRHVTMSQQMITLRILESMGTDGIHGVRDRVAPGVRHALWFLKLLFDANLMRQNRYLDYSNLHNLITFQEIKMGVSEFYNDGINSTPEITKLDFSQYFRGTGPYDFDLVNHSFVLDAATKAEYFLKTSIMTQELQSRGSLLRIMFDGVSAASPFLVLRVRRDEIVHDALRKLTATVSEDELKKPLKVQFDDEAGIDEGGVAKEFFQLLVEKLFNVDYGMFEYDEETSLYWFNGNSLESSLQFELIGVVLGLAIYNGVILDLHFPLCVYKKLLDVPIGIIDLFDFKAEVAKSLIDLLHMSEETLASLELTFSIEVSCYGHIEERPLSSEFDQDQPVTIENREDYVRLYVKWILEDSIHIQFKAFYKGFAKCCKIELIKKLFQPEELLLLICGADEFNLTSLESVTKYQDGYTSESQTIRDFWDIAHHLTPEDQKKLLFFVTGSDRVPIKGLSALQFFIGRSGGDTDRLPTAHTCFNFLLLPDYNDKEKLKHYLTRALKHHTGFGLR